MRLSLTNSFCPPRGSGYAGRILHLRYKHKCWSTRIGISRPASKNGKRLTSEMSIAKRLCAWLFRSFSPQWITKCFVATSLKATSQVSKLVLVLFSAPSVLLPVGVQLSLPQRIVKNYKKCHLVISKLEALITNRYVWRVFEVHRYVKI